ncbi:MAG: acyl-CoA dehydratase activase [Bacteroidales bacterium]|nr:acyl-CoA dehydratase activase [Bacteroidales bacterium]
MITAGIDIGSTTGKAVILIDDKIILGKIIPVTTKPAVTAQIALDEALKNAGLNSVADIQYIISTGYGRLKVDFANENISEISCHARGAFHLLPSVRTIIDIGGQDCKAISLNAKGGVLGFEMNERCAAGTGRFFQVMSKVLACGLEGIGAVENISQTPANISNQCSVFAESEVISLVNNDVPLPDIITGINRSVAARVSGLVRRAGLANDLVVTGGCYNNDGLKHALEGALAVKVTNLPLNPQFMGALGAAVFAHEKLIVRQNPQ